MDSLKTVIFFFFFMLHRNLIVVSYTLKYGGMCANVAEKRPVGRMISFRHSREMVLISRWQPIMYIYIYDTARTLDESAYSAVENPYSSRATAVTGK